MDQKTAKKKIGPRQSAKVVWPKAVEDYWNITPVTRWRWERKRKLPARDVFLAGVAVGWKPETLDAAMRGEAVGTAA